MTKPEAERLTIEVDADRRVSGLLMLPAKAKALVVLAHGAGAGMTHPFLANAAGDLAERGIGTLRYQFPYMEARGRRPDTPKVAHASVRAAVEEARRRAPKLPLIAAGKSFGGRMTSQAAAESPLPGVTGIAFFGFPLHPPGRPSDERGEHLARVTVPMLFLQGTRDEFAELSLLEPLVAHLGKMARLHLIEGANHSFKVPAKSGRTDADVRAELADTLAAWVATLSAR